MVIYFYSILNQLFFSTYLNHARNRSWNQQVLSNVSKVSYSKKQRVPLSGLELMPGRLW